MSARASRKRSRSPDERHRSGRHKRHSRSPGRRHDKIRSQVRSQHHSPAGDRDTGSRRRHAQASHHRQSPDMPHHRSTSHRYHTDLGTRGTTDSRSRHSRSFPDRNLRRSPTPIQPVGSSRDQDKDRRHAAAERSRRSCSPQHHNVRRVKSNPSRDRSQAADTGHDRPHDNANGRKRRRSPDHVQVAPENKQHADADPKRSSTDDVSTKPAAPGNAQRTCIPAKHPAAGHDEAQDHQSSPAPASGTAHPNLVTSAAAGIVEADQAATDAAPASGSHSAIDHNVYGTRHPAGLNGRTTVPASVAPLPEHDAADLQPPSIRPHTADVKQEHPAAEQAHQTAASRDTGAVSPNQVGVALPAAELAPAAGKSSCFTNASSRISSHEANMLADATAAAEMQQPPTSQAHAASSSSPEGSVVDNAPHEPQANTSPGVRAFISAAIRDEVAAGRMLQPRQQPGDQSHSQHAVPATQSVTDGAKPASDSAALAITCPALPEQPAKRQKATAGAGMVWAGDDLSEPPHPSQPSRPGQEPGLSQQAPGNGRSSTAKPVHKMPGKGCTVTVSYCLQMGMQIE